MVTSPSGALPHLARNVIGWRKDPVVMLAAPPLVSSGAAVPSQGSAGLDPSFPITVIVRHPKENPRKCSILPLRDRPDILLLKHPVTERPRLDGDVRLA